MRASRARLRGQGWWGVGAGEGEGEARRATLWCFRETCPPPSAPFHSHKAGFVSIYLLDFSAKMLLEKHIALI